MNKGLLLAAVLLGLCLSSLAEAQNQRTYRWVDDEGVVHFGDSVPAEFAEKDKDVLNKQGVAVDFVKGKITEEELAERARLKKQAAEQAIIDRQNRVLLATYQSEEEISMHRDRRLELIEAQGKVANLYLANLQTRVDLLNNDAQRFRPYSDDPEAPPVPLSLSSDLEETRARISRYEKLKEENQAQADTVKQRFDADLDRFRRLKSTTY